MRHQRKKPSGTWVQMDDIESRNSNGSTGKDGTKHQEEVTESGRGGDVEGYGPSGSAQREGAVEDGDADVTRDRVRRHRWSRGHKQTYSHAHFRVYKRRWFGLAQLVLLNIVISWDVCG